MVCRRCPKQKVQKEKVEGQDRGVREVTTSSANIGTAGLGGPDPEEERDPPPGPTPLNFPVHPKTNTIAWGDNTPPPNLQALFARIIKPVDLKAQHLEALNIDFQPEVDAENLVPRAADGSSYLPPLISITYADATKMDPANRRKRKDFAERLAELRIDNDTAFRTICRTVPHGTKPPRLAYMRKFWEGLESMSRYWDCSLDHYYEVNEESDGGQPAKRQKMEVPSSEAQHASDRNGSEAEKTSPDVEDQIRRETSEAYERDQRANDASDDAAKPTGSPQETNDVSGESSTTLEPRSRMRYTGRRTSTGRLTPDQVRADTVRGFVEGTVWPFRASVAPPRVLPLVQVNKLNLPVRQTAAVNRVPLDRTKARAGWIEGPLIGVQERAQTEFLMENGKQDEGKARLDLMREVGGLLQLAQERYREGKTEKKPGEGKWWTTKPRWGGGTGSEVETDIENGDVVEAAKELLGATKEAKSDASSKARKRKVPAMLWKELKCGSSMWDSRTEYKAVGKDPHSSLDDVRQPCPPFLIRCCIDS